MLSDWVRLGTRLIRVLRDKRHEARHDAVIDRLLSSAQASVTLRQERDRRVPHVDYPGDLPISARRDDIIKAIQSNQIVIVAGETGSGKTTQLPKMCLEAGLGIEAKIACTQPRRVAALAISKRISSELNVAWGREVGCKIRFDDRSNRETYIKLLTDGMLLAEIQGDPLMTEYNAVIIDEAHERNLNIDFLLGYLKGLLAKRDDLKLIITSATIDTESFSRAFDNAPILEVSGRMFPVDVIYSPLDGDSEESGDLTYIDAAVNAVTQIIHERERGDVLVFMPTERDIRETRDLLNNRFGKDAEIVPLFGRLSSGEQQQVFEPAQRRKIVVATNIAETSLTIPGIRWVIDSGFARISRYNARTRTKRLPIEPISQSSANQRKGRAGRLEHGMCIRLYSEEDLESRSQYTQPEIQRANLAEVILRMKAFQLGEIETFPFVNPPDKSAIHGGYKLLRELGAIDKSHSLTPVGEDLARLPIDPTLGRMLIESQRERSTSELLIIAAGLSIQDPRERPIDRKDEASAAHKGFADSKSDFITLLNIWKAVHDQWESLRTQNQRRRFCKKHFLSYTRMREWQDLHAQLRTSLDDIYTLRLNERAASYDAIHRAILSGLLGHVAFGVERNIFRTVENRRVTVFPASALFQRTEAKKSKIAEQKSDRQKKPAKQPTWIVAGEIVETSQHFARTVAGIDPMWMVDLASHICTATREEPHWCANAGRVLINERLVLYGLEIHRRKVDYGKINSEDATHIFIRSALVEGNLFGEPELQQTSTNHSSRPVTRGRSRGNHDTKKLEKPYATAECADSKAEIASTRYPFLNHNRRVRDKIENWRTRIRQRDAPDVDQKMFEFYAQRIQNVSSIHELNRLLRENEVEGFLCVTAAELTGGIDVDYDETSFPDAATLGGQPVTLSYAYAPGEEWDGVTVTLPLELARTVSGSNLDWAVPGLRKGKIAELLRALPKALRRKLMPFPAKIERIVQELKPSGDSLISDLARFIREHYGVMVQSADWRATPLPNYLQPRIEIVANDRRVLEVGRDLTTLRQNIDETEPAGDSPEWSLAERRWERFDLKAWTCEDLPERIVVKETNGLPEFGWPGLEVEEQSVNVRLFRDRETSRRSSLGGVQRLVEIVLEKDLAWLRKDLRALARLEPLTNSLTTLDQLQSDAYENLRRHILPKRPLEEMNQARFSTEVEEARKRVRGIAPSFLDCVDRMLRVRQEILRRFGSQPAPSGNAPSVNSRPMRLSDLKQFEAPKKISSIQAIMASELEALFPRDFLARIPFVQLEHMPRYLKAVLIRGERAVLNPPKDQERVGRLTPFLTAYAELRKKPPDGLAGKKQLEEFRWMIEEFKVSLFAQELGTPIPISDKRLSKHLELVRKA